jgi:hypothetical protein
MKRDLVGTFRSLRANVTSARAKFQFATNMVRTGIHAHLGDQGEEFIAYFPFRGSGIRGSYFRLHYNLAGMGT